MGKECTARVSHISLSASPAPLGLPPLTDAVSVEVSPPEHHLPSGLLNEDHTSTPDPTSKRRFHELDALRGLAACSVVLLHFRDMWNVYPSSTATHSHLLLWEIFDPLSNGHLAVIMFFVLSGLVLTLPYLNGRAQPYPLYLLRRALRIGGPYLVALGLSLLGQLAFRRHPLIYGPWANRVWLGPVQARLLLEHILLIGYFSPVYLFVAWSLQVEMRVSLIFPALLRCTRPLGNLGRMALILVLFACYLATKDNLPFVTTLALQDLQFIAIFLIGILLADNLEPIAAWWAGSPRRLQTAIAVLSFILYSYSPLLSGKFLAVVHVAKPTVALETGIPNLLTGIGAAGIVIVVMNYHPLRNLLNRQAGRFAGRISYSLYLVHISVLFALRFSLKNRLSMYAQLPLYLACSLLVAWLFCLFVEEPFIRLGRALR